MDSPPAETIEEKMPEENAEETDMLASEEPPAKQGTDWSVYVPLYVGTLRIKELTPAIVSEFIKKIIVHAPEKLDGKRIQKVDIIFNFVGEINFLSATQPKRQGA